MRVLQVVPTSGPGGAEQIVLSLSKGLARSGIEVAVASHGREPYLFEKLGNLGIRAIALKSPDRKHLVPEILAGIRSFRPDIVNSHMFDANLPAALAGVLCRVPVVATLHSTVYELETRKRRLFNMLMGRCASRLVAVSQAVSSAFVKAGAPSRKINLIYNGVDVSQFANNGRSRLRQEFGIADTDHLVGMIANLRPAKDHELLIHSAAMVVAHIPNAQFVLVGDGVDSKATDLIHLISKLGMARHVYLAGFRDNIPDVLGALDLFALASKIEGLPVSVIEAMAAGLPVVASRVGGMHEVIEEGVTGFLVPPQNRDALAQKITNILSDRALAATLGEAGRRRSIRIFSLEAMTDAYCRLYAECLA